MTNKVFVKGNEVLNLDELKDDVVVMEDILDDHGSDCDDCCGHNHKNDLIDLLKAELANEIKKGDNDDYIKELKETIEKMQMM